MGDDTTGDAGSIRFKKVGKTYPGLPRPVLDHVSLRINRGEFVFLIGASGAGKSSVLRLILADTTPSSGTALVAGADVRRLRGRALIRHRHRIGAVFQDFRLLDDRTVAQNVAFALHVTGAGRRQISERVPEVLEQIGIAEIAGRYPPVLSGGEQQRVAIARAIAARPDLLLADEPTGNLDPDTAAEIMAVFDQLHTGGLTVVMATHNVAVVDAGRHRVVALERGRVVRDSTIGRYLAGPVT